LPRVAYLSMEIALEPAIPTYAGGLGVLAGDTLRSAADLGFEMCAVTLLHRRGYFRQVLDAKGEQREEPVAWDYEARLEALEPRVEVSIEGRRVALRAWRYRMEGFGGHRVPVFLLDADLPENDPGDRRLTDHLYGGDARYRLCQEVILGVGGVRMLRALGYRELQRFHLNEGHAALATLALVEERTGLAAPADGDFEAIRGLCVFTTHTPVQAGHDRFGEELAAQVLEPAYVRWLRELGLENLNMTELALRASRFVNGVALIHGEVSRGMFPDYPIHSITNGIHPATWTAPPLAALFDRHMPAWRKDALTLRYAVGLPLDELARAHAEAKTALVARVRRETDADFRPEPFTIGFARRATAYKRATLILHDLERLAAIGGRTGPLQIVFAGKAHPADQEGKAMIRRIVQTRDALAGRGVELAYLADYDMDLARPLVSGCDLWLNNPVPPLEASGTSGMKAALNGVPSLSVRDGWWAEGHVEGATGWSIGDGDGDFGPGRGDDARDADALYQKLELAILPAYWERRRRYLAVMRNAIALNASFFNTQRMVLQYLYEAYEDGGADAGAPRRRRPRPEPAR